jgi:hypothetical protein
MTEESKSNELTETISPILDTTQHDTEPTPSAEPTKKKRKLSEKQMAALEKGRQTRWQKKATKQVLQDNDELASTIDKLSRSCQIILNLLTFPLKLI